MNIEEIRAYCLAKPFSDEAFPFGESTMVFRVLEKMFVLYGLENIDPSINLKCDPEYAIELRERYPSITPGYHMSKKMWNTIYINELNNDLLLRRLIDHSFNEVVKGLPKYKQAFIKGLEK